MDFPTSTTGSHGIYQESQPIGGLYGLPLDSTSDELLKLSFPSELDTLIYLDTLKRSNLSHWQTIEEVSAKSTTGSCQGSVNTAILSALYLLGLFNLCTASPVSCCMPPNNSHRKKRSHSRFYDQPAYHQHTFSSLPVEAFQSLPHISAPHGGNIPIHISVVDQVRKLWDSNPRLHSDVECRDSSQNMRSSFISLSGTASGIILAYSVSQIDRCFPSYQLNNYNHSRIWLYPLLMKHMKPKSHYMVRSLPPQLPVRGNDENIDDCGRTSVPMSNGGCAALFTTGPCPYMHWVVLNRDNNKGECIPRVCSEGRVFIESDQMCHSVDEPGLCPRDQRLFLTAWGEPVCDCLDGMYHGPDDKCYQIYEPAYCYERNVLQFDEDTEALDCQSDPCYFENSKRQTYELPFALDNNGNCVQLGSVGACRSLERFGFDIDELSPACVSLHEAGLIRAPQSFQYSHISFPSSVTEKMPHYEVSYVILNGSIWELMMRSIDRPKRETSNYETKGPVLKFIDTRNFPDNLNSLQAEFEAIQIAISSKGHKRDKRLTFYKQHDTLKKISMENISKNLASHLKTPIEKDRKISFEYWRNNSIPLKKTVREESTRNRPLVRLYNFYPPTETSESMRGIKIIKKVPQEPTIIHNMNKEPRNSKIPQKWNNFRKRANNLSKLQRSANTSKSKSRLRYLRNRGRRQTYKHGNIPGIINAPLLNQCRPGAKRDYNGHCRPRIIPESKAISRRSKKNSPHKPLSPRIKCRKGTRLTIRGKCKKTFSGLG